VSNIACPRCGNPHKRQGVVGTKKRRQYHNSQLRVLEWEVRLYHETKAELEEEKDSIILQAHTSPDGMPRGSGVSDDTYNRAQRLLNSAEVREMERKIRAIDRARDEWCARDPIVRMEFIRLKFWDNTLTSQGIAQRLNVAEQTVRYWRKGFLTLVGKYLGWRV